MCSQIAQVVKILQHQNEHFLRIMSYDDTFSRCAERRTVLGLAKVQRFVLLISMLAIGELTWGSCCLFWLGLIPGLLLPLCVLWTGPGQVCACA